MTSGLILRTYFLYGTVRIQVGERGASTHEVDWRIVEPPYDAVSAVMPDGWEEEDIKAAAERSIRWWRNVGSADVERPASSE